METLLTSPTRTVRIGPDQPFVMIGERINPTGRKLLAAEMAAGNFDRVRSDPRFAALVARLKLPDSPPGR